MFHLFNTKERRKRKLRWVLDRVVEVEKATGNRLIAVRVALIEFDLDEKERDQLINDVFDMYAIELEL